MEGRQYYRDSQELPAITSKWWFSATRDDADQSDFRPANFSEMTKNIRLVGYKLKKTDLLEHVFVYFLSLNTMKKEHNRSVNRMTETIYSIIIDRGQQLRLPEILFQQGGNGSCENKNKILLEDIKNLATMMIFWMMAAMLKLDTPSLISILSWFIQSHNTIRGSQCLITVDISDW